MADKSFVLRMEMQNGQMVVRGLNDIADTGENAMRRINRAVATQATPAMRAWSAAVQESSTRVAMLASGLGPAGAALTAMGKSGLIAAAGLGAAAAAAVMIGDRALQALERLDDLADTSARLGTTAGELVKWQAAVETAGGEMADFASSAQQFQERLGALFAGVGKNRALTQTLERLGLSRETLFAAETLRERLLLVADALSKVEDRAQRASLADKLGLASALPLLEQGRNAVERITAEFDGLGRAADEGVARAGEMASTIKTLQMELQIRSDNLFVRAAPYIASMYRMLTDILKLADDPRWKAIWGVALGGALNTGSALAQVQTPSTTASSVRRRIDELRSRIADPDVGLFGEVGPEQRQKMMVEIEFLQKLVPALAAVEGARDAAAAANDGVVLPETVDGLDREGDAAAKAAERFRELEAARRAWRDDPEAKGRWRQDAEKISDRVTDGMEGGELGALTRSAASAAALRDEFRNAFRYAFSKLSEGDFAGAAEAFAGAFMNKINDRISDQLFDLVWDNLGLGDAASSLFGPLDAAQSAQAVAVTQSTTALTLMTVAAQQAAAALTMVSAGGAGGGGGFGGVIGGIASFAASLFGGGRAGGGSTEAGKVYRWQETNGEQFIMANRDGFVQSPHAVAAMADRQAQAARGWSGGGDRPINVQNIVHNNAGVDVEQRQTRDGNGGLKLETILNPKIDARMKENLQNGRTDSAMRSRLGARPRLQSR